MFVLGHCEFEKSKRGFVDGARLGSDCDSFFARLNRSDFPKELETDPAVFSYFQLVADGPQGVAS